MKNILLNKYVSLLLLGLCLLNSRLHAQEDPVVKKELVKLHYVNSNNKLQWVLVETVVKIGKKSEPSGNKTVQLYLDSSDEKNIISTFSTDANGKAKIGIPPAVKSLWDASSKHTLIAVTGKGDDEKTYELEVNKARISLDTSTVDSAKNITVKVEQFVNDSWMPAKDVELKIGVQRLGGILSGGEESTYTTDSMGIATLVFKLDSLPGDTHGMLGLIAKAEDNELFGTLIAEKAVPWGKSVKPNNDFFSQRTLWSTRFRTPYWLLFMAYSIILTVWGTLIYLISRIFKIKKLGAVVQD